MIMQVAPILRNRWSTHLPILNGEANKALHLTAFPLRSKSADELSR